MSNMFDTQTAYPCMPSGPAYPNPHTLPSCSLVSKPRPVPAELMARPGPGPKPPAPAAPPPQGPQPAAGQDPSPSAPHTITAPGRIHTVTDMDFDDSFDEEDDYSDCEMDDMTFDRRPAADEGDIVTDQLLQFAEMVNGDIQKYFGRKKGDDDSCDIYEDKWTSRKSGRELYYADLLRVAQGDDGGGEEKRRSSAAVKDKITDPHTGRMDASAGLGPLEELFRRSVRDAKTTDTKSPADRNRKCGTGSGVVSSLSGRKLPESFWSEPQKSVAGKTRSGAPGKAEQGKGEGKGEGKVEGKIEGKGEGKADAGGKTQNGLVLAPSKTPDFSDLLESWAGEEQLGPGVLNPPANAGNQESNSTRR